MNPSDFEKVLESEELRNRFRVVVFGSARSKPGDPIYKEVYELGKAIAEHGFDIVTGGGPGAMEAANLGHSSAANENEVDSFGLNIKLPFEQSINKGVEIAHEHTRFSTRLDEFMSLANIVVVTQGGVGTCLELFYTWQLMQIKQMTHIPIVLVGDMWNGLIDWLEEDVLTRGMFNKEDLNVVHQVKDCNEAIEVIDEWHRAWTELGDKVAYQYNMFEAKEARPYKVIFDRHDNRKK